MRLDELYEGQKVYVWDWSEEYDEPPDHWAGAMEDYIGAVVTIAHINMIGDYAGDVSIMEDGGRFHWTADDFDYHECLPTSDPNIRFRAHQQHRKWQKIKKENERNSFLKRNHKNNYG